MRGRPALRVAAWGGLAGIADRPSTHGWSAIARRA